MKDIKEIESEKVKDCINEESGIVKISEEVVSTIAYFSSLEVKGIIGMTSAGGINQLSLGKKNPSKGVRVTINGDNAVIDLYVIVKYGVRIAEVAKDVQTNVKKSVESLTGLKVSSINVHIQDVLIKKQAENENISIEEK
ncbi:MAG: Asp23/Gls24 family envelope stress response protein [Oscillospiraceae bacterium]|nr:Asp23/Gls24 family envelope stress response protein [Oscillospiraceae bacterium]